MDSNWTLAVRREYIGGNPRYDFPIRPLGWGKLLGLFLVGFGGAFIGMPIRMAVSALRDWMEKGSDFGNVLFSLFPLLFVIAGIFPLGMGLLILFGRCRVEWREGQLIAMERLGPFWWTRRLPRKPIRKLEVSLATSTSGTEAPKPIERFSGMMAEFEDGSKRVVVIGYPRAWVLACAQELTRYVGGVSSGINPVKVEVVETIPEKPNDEAVLQQPVGSQVQVEQRPGHARYFIPPAGVWRGSKGLLFFGVLWCGFMVIFTTLLFSKGIQGEDRWAWLSAVAFFAVFWLIGIGVLVGAVNMGKRTATFTIAGNRLRIMTQGLFGTKQWEWPQEQIVAIRVDASGMEVNDRPVLELQIHPHSGKKVGLLSGRNEVELRWLATQLRQALQVGARKAAK